MTWLGSVAAYGGGPKHRRLARPAGCNLDDSLHPTLKDSPDDYGSQEDGVDPIDPLLLGDAARLLQPTCSLGGMHP